MNASPTVTTDSSKEQRESTALAAVFWRSLATELQSFCGEEIVR
jgi:hypothetical protein